MLPSRRERSGLAWLVALVLGCATAPSDPGLPYRQEAEAAAAEGAPERAVAAYQLYGGPVIVVDFGTATVFDAINGDGDYLGGAIAPGMNIAAEALFEHASKRPRIAVARPRQTIVRNTVG